MLSSPPKTVGGRLNGLKQVAPGSLGIYTLHHGFLPFWTAQHWKLGLLNSVRYYEDLEEKDD